MKASNMIPDKNISMLFKGGNGLGKTIAASSFALYGPIWIAYFDKRTPVELYTFWHKMGRKDVLENIDYTSYSSANANEYLNDLMKMSREPGRYIAGITDSLTMLTAAAVNWSMGFRTAGGKKDTKSSNPLSAAIIPDFDEYKVETSLVTQALDLCKVQPWYNIWTAHPLPSLKIEGQGTNVASVKTETSLVTYGSKVAGIVPGNFTEIYHFSRQGDERRVWTDSIGDQFAKTAYDLPKYFDITNKLFAEEWKRLVNDGLGKLFKEGGENNVVEGPFGQSPRTENTDTKKWRV